MTTLDRMSLDSPLGQVDIVLRGQRVCAVDFADRWPVVERHLRRRFGAIEWRVNAGAGARRGSPAANHRLRQRFVRYFKGQADALRGLTLDLGGTPFQQAIWRALLRVPAGATTTYADLARAAGHPRAARAAGRAAGLNPAALVVPCHRAVGSDGALRGYAGGLARKAWLLSHEAQTAPRARRTSRA